MKFTSVGIASLMVLGLASTVSAQDNRFQNPQQCVAEVGTLDANSDGFVDNTEYSQYGDIQTSVDTDSDGKISQDELTVACDSDLANSLMPKG